MYVRLAFAVAAHLEPEVLLVDEVLAVGDIAFQKKCLGKMHDVAKAGRTVLFVSHNLSAIQRLCTYGYLLHNGQLIQVGRINSVLDAYHNLINSDDQETVDIRSVPAGSVRYLSWCSQSSGLQGQTYCTTQEACVLDFKLVVRRKINTATFGLLIFDNNGNWILGVRRGLQAGECVQLTEGVYNVRFSMPALPLKPGNYVLQAAVGDLYEGNLDEWYAQPRLTILPKDGAIMFEEWGGVLNIEGEIEIYPLE